MILLYRFKPKNVRYAALLFSARNADPIRSGKRKITAPQNVHAQGQ
jgi:hypothetical protein